MATDQDWLPFNHEALYDQALQTKCLKSTSLRGAQRRSK
jgi:hypothetical protein